MIHTWHKIVTVEWLLSLVSVSGKVCLVDICKYVLKFLSVQPLISQFVFRDISKEICIQMCHIDLLYTENLSTPTT